MTRFIAELMDPNLPAPADLTDGQARPAGRRFDVHRNNVVQSLCAALRLGFPTVARVLGRDNMDRVAGQFVRLKPPSDPRMMYYGAGFPAFLASVKPLKYMPYLADIARLDLAVRRAYHAREAQAMAPDHLASIPPEKLLQSTVQLAPAVQVIRSDWPILDLWNDALTANSHSQDILITRPEFDPVPQVLPPGGATWIAALQRRAPICEALDLALVETAHFDMGAPLTLLLLGGALISLN